MRKEEGEKEKTNRSHRVPAGWASWGGVWNRQ